MIGPLFGCGQGPKVENDLKKVFSPYEKNKVRNSKSFHLNQNKVSADSSTKFFLKRQN